MVAINPQRIEGNWRSGWALDFSTTSSVPIGNNAAGFLQFETTRPEIAELMYQLKYKGNDDAAPGIIAAASEFLARHKTKFDFLIPVPPSTKRAKQPVHTLAHGIGEAIGLPVLHCIATTRVTAALKGISDPVERRELVNGLYAVAPNCVVGKRVLLFDDLFRSGTTMTAITDVLYDQGLVASVCALTITKTRSNQ